MDVDEVVGGLITPTKLGPKPRAPPATLFQDAAAFGEPPADLDDVLDRLLAERADGGGMLGEHGRTGVTDLVAFAMGSRHLVLHSVRRGCGGIKEGPCQGPLSIVRLQPRQTRRCGSRSG
jgi:hypothetical protein